jgi:hypothetical protein
VIACVQTQSDGASESPLVERPGCTTRDLRYDNQRIAIMTRYLCGRCHPKRVRDLALWELAMPDLDLIKQEEQVWDKPGQVLGLGLREGDEFVRLQGFLLSPGRGEGRYRDEPSE